MVPAIRGVYLDQVLGVPQPDDDAELLKLIPKDPAVLEALRKQVAAECWRRGELEYRLHTTQKKIRTALSKSTRRKFFLLCSRRLGKTFVLLALAFEQAIQKPGSRILFLAPYAKDATEIATDIANQLLSDCPQAAKPDIKQHTKEIIFGNGSIIRLRGVNSEAADSLRGGAADLIILDECGQMDQLAYVVQSVCMPMTLTTNGRIILATTPAVSPAHDSTAIYKDLDASGDAVKFTLLDAPEEHISYERKAEYLREYGEQPENIPDILAGKRQPETTSALREFWVRFVTDASRAVIPEMLRMEHKIVGVHKRPGVFDAYTAVDPGFRDASALVFGYYDFTAGKIVIEDEALLRRASTTDIAKALLETEWRLWANEKPYMRVLDNDPRLAADLFERHGLVFSAAQKPDALGSINYLRTIVANEEIIISPKCTKLIEQLRDTVWNANATDFARTSDGHADLLSALRYLVRAINRHRNPFPPGYIPPGFTPGSGGAPGSFRSPRQRFKTGRVGQQLDLLGDTPAGKKLGKK